ncbi:MAG: ribokinase [Lachnospiraceae bacterium]|nr:ribokinase [Lachnospiraceae bacterium]
MNKPKILVVGSMNMDLLIYDVPRIPKMGESVFCSSYAYATGGKGSNQAFAASKQGAEVVMVGRVGADDNGRILAKEIEKAGVRTDCLSYDKEAQTGLAIMNVDKEGKYFSCVALGANENLSPQDVEAALEKEKFDMVVMQLEMPLEVVYRTYEMAAERNIPVFLDAGPAMSIPLERLKGIFVISPNEAETEALTGISVENEEKAILAAKKLYKEAEPQYVLLKMGSRGAMLYDGKEAKMIPCFHVDAVDSTAAGDTFGAAFAVQYCKGAKMEEAIRFGHAAAGICVSKKGGQPSIPTEEETTEFLKQQN